MNAHMKVSEQCRIAASKGNQVLGMIRRNITYTEKSLIIPLYKGPATRNDFVNDIVDDARADAIFATLKTIVDDGSSTISSTISLRVAGP